MSVDGPFQFVEIHLFVTGHTERQSLPALFSRLTETGVCSVTVARKIRQRSPRTGPSTKRIGMVGARGDRIPTRDEQEISFPARHLLREAPANRLLLLIDDLENDRRDDAPVVFARYRSALDRLLEREEQQQAAVHFLVNMLEAYFFSDEDLRQTVTGADPPGFEGDVEEIPHPKNRLKKICAYREAEHGPKLLQALDLHRVLGDPETCSWLRSAVRWITNRLQRQLDEDLHPTLEPTVNECHLEHGRTHAFLVEQRLPDGA